MKHITRYLMLIVGVILMYIGINVPDNGGLVIAGLPLVLFGLLVASRSSMLGYGKNMQMINGIGTTLYGKSDFNSTDNTYISTKYFVFIFLPIVPIASYRVKAKASEVKFLGTKTSYDMVPVALNIPQILLTYLLTWGVLIAIGCFLYFR